MANEIKLKLTTSQQTDTTFNIPFVPKSVTVDNPTSRWVYIYAIDTWVPPFTYHFITNWSSNLPITEIDASKVPQSATSIQPVQDGSVIFDFVDTVLQPSAGTSFNSAQLALSQINIGQQNGNTTATYTLPAGTHAICFALEITTPNGAFPQGMLVETVLPGDVITWLDDRLSGVQSYADNKWPHFVMLSPDETTVSVTIQEYVPGGTFVNQYWIYAIVDTSFVAVAGRVSIDGMTGGVGSLPVSLANFTNPLPVTWSTAKPISGSVAITGSVVIGNFPSTQTVTWVGSPSVTVSGVVTISSGTVNLSAGTKIIPQASSTLGMLTYQLGGSFATPSTTVLIAGQSGKSITVYGYEITIHPTSGSTTGIYNGSLQDTTSAVFVARTEIQLQTAIGLLAHRWARAMIYGVPLPVGAGLELVIPSGMAGALTCNGTIDYTIG